MCSVHATLSHTHYRRNIFLSLGGRVETNPAFFPTTGDLIDILCAKPFFLTRKKHTCADAECTKHFKKCEIRRFA
jgi:hypothetical protein